MIKMTLPCLSKKYRPKVHFQDASRKNCSRLVQYTVHFNFLFCFFPVGFHLPKSTNNLKASKILYISSRCDPLKWDKTFVAGQLVAFFLKIAKITSVSPVSASHSDVVASWRHQMFHCVSVTTLKTVIICLLYFVCMTPHWECTEINKFSPLVLIAVAQRAENRTRDRPVVWKKYGTPQ
jgi:hypothetical protein